MQMKAGGATLADIRNAIEGKYRPSFNTITPTAPVPK
jgi:hypothetical protein